MLVLPALFPMVKQVRSARLQNAQQRLAFRTEQEAFSTSASLTFLAIEAFSALS